MNDDVLATFSVPGVYSKRKQTPDSEWEKHPKTVVGQPLKIDAKIPFSLIILGPITYCWELSGEHGYDVEIVCRTKKRYYFRGKLVKI